MQQIPCDNTERTTLLPLVHYISFLASKGFYIMTVPLGVPHRLYLMQLATLQPGDIPMPGYLIQTNDGINILIDTGCAKKNIGPHEEFGGVVVEMAEQDHILQQLATIGLTPDDIHTLVCTHFDFDHAGN